MVKTIPIGKGKAMIISSNRDGIDTIDMQGLLVFFVIIILIVALLVKTDLFYANPILMLLGYKVIRFNFTHNSKFGGKEVIGICPSRINYNKVIKYKIITDAVILMK